MVLDFSISMQTQVIVTTRLAFYHQRLFRLLVCYLDSQDLATVVLAMVTSRLDYYNFFYAGLSSDSEIAGSAEYGGTGADGVILADFHSAHA